MRDLPRDLATTVRKGGYIFQNVRGVRFSIGENVRVSSSSIKLARVNSWERAELFSISNIGAGAVSPTLMTL